MTDQPEGRARTMAEINASLRTNRCSLACSDQHTYVAPCQATAPPTLRDRAIDAAKQAINALGMWLPPAGREAVVDAVLALTIPEACCVCGGGPVTYREQQFCQPCTNGKPSVCTFCGGDGYDPEDPGDYDPAVHQHNPSTRQPCPECIQKGLPPRLGIRPAGQSALDLIRASIEVREAKAEDEHDAGRHRLSNEHNAIAAGLRIAEAHILANPDAELDASQRRAVRIQQLLDDTRDRMRKDAAASRESERQLQQQIDAQAREIDRLRDEIATLGEDEEELPINLYKTYADQVAAYCRRFGHVRQPSNPTSAVPAALRGPNWKPRPTT